MTGTRLATGVLLLVISILGLESPGTADTGSEDNGTTNTSQPGADLKGTWSGTFQSKHADTSFTITVVIDPDNHGRLVGRSSHDSVCLKDVELQVTVKGSTIYLAGSDPEGNSITFRGTIDKSGTLLNLHYIINGSAGGRCESDDGNGTLGKR